MAFNLEMSANLPLIEFLLKSRQMRVQKCIDVVHRLKYANALKICGVDHVRASYGWRQRISIRARNSKQSDQFVSQAVEKRKCVTKC